MMKKGKSKNGGGVGGGGMLPTSLKIISSCLKTVSTNASTVVRSAGASVIASVSASTHGTKDQVTWSGFDRLVISPLISKRVLLLGYQNGFQVYDVQDAANFTELVSKKDCSHVSFLQILPIPAMSTVCNEGFESSHPLLLVVAREEVVNNTSNEVQGNQSENNGDSPTAVKFYSLRTNCFVHVLRFRSVICMVRCSTKMVAIALPTQIYCIDAVTLENKFSVLTYPVPQFGRRGKLGVNVGYGPMAVGPRWLAYASESPIMTSKSRLSPKNLNPSQVVSRSLSLGSSSNQVAHYAMESSKHIAAGLISMGDKGYRTFSRYCQELIQDGLSSPSPSSSGWKCGRVVAPRTENAGMVVVKDFVSRAVISQFSAHTSPLSALCFDPSGTLLVTASIHGNNINIFRITPNYARSDSGDRTYDWSSSHVHLYKLYRGMTSAIIQDICFNHCSQWIAFMSSKGTCHIYTLSPFGGEIELQTSDCHSACPISYPVLSSPWWSTSTFLINPPVSLPPATVTLSVVCRIKDYTSGVINSVSNVASLAGNGYIPSGAITGIFHNSMAVDVGDSFSGSNMLEHLLVYSSSGHLVQYGLLPGVGVQQSSNGRLLSHSNARIHAQDNNLDVKVEPIEWWDVCRKFDGIERDASLEFPMVSKQEAFEVQRNNYVQFNSSIVGEKTSRGIALNAHEKSQVYLCNAEVQINSRRLPIWQNPKISFQRMVLPRNNIHDDGENEIETFQLTRGETRRKDFLPVFDNSQFITSERKKSSITSSPHLAHQTGENVMKETGICHSNPASLSSAKDSKPELKYAKDIPGSPRIIENLINFDQSNNEKDHVNNLYMQISNTENCSPLPKNIPSTISYLHPSDCLTEVVRPLAERNLSFQSCEPLGPIMDQCLALSEVVAHSSSENNEEGDESILLSEVVAHSSTENNEEGDESILLSEVVAHSSSEKNEEGDESILLSEVVAHSSSENNEEGDENDLFGGMFVE